MDKIKILVVEDEVIIADDLCDTLEDLGYFTFEPVTTYTEAVAQIEVEKPDIAILDIELGGRKSGIDLAQKIRKSYNFPFIFLTSNTDTITVEKAKKVNPPAYLAKPFTKENIYTSIEIALSNHQKNEQPNKFTCIAKEALFIKEKKAYKKIKFCDIQYLKSDHVYTEIKLNNSSIKIVRIGLNTIINQLGSQFIRVHRSYIVNFDYLTEIDTSSLKISTDIIPIGLKYKDDLLENLNLIK